MKRLAKLLAGRTEDWTPPRSAWSTWSSGSSWSARTGLDVRVSATAVSLSARKCGAADP